jgi:hypothetical protein
MTQTVVHYSSKYRHLGCQSLANVLIDAKRLSVRSVKAKTLVPMSEQVIDDNRSGRVDRQLAQMAGVHSWFYKAVICRRGRPVKKPMFSTFFDPPLRILEKSDIYCFRMPKCH